MRNFALLSVLGAFVLGGCGELESFDDFDDIGDQRIKSEPGKMDSSAEAIFLSFEFDAEVLTSSSWNPSGQIEDQLLYTIGHLNGENSVGRLDKLELSNLQKSSAAGGLTLIKYHAKLPVAWGHKTGAPSSYTLKLPRNISYDGQQSFTEKYKSQCVDWSAHDVDTGSMWYYYRPSAYSCKLDPADIVTTVATVKPSPIGTTGKFPEYNKLWEDKVLKVMAVFGKFEDGATSASDAGISAYNSFVGKLRQALAANGLKTNPANVPYQPGVAAPDIEFTATLAAGRTIQVVALLVDNVRTAGPTFDARFRQLSSSADLIAYNGHAGLGANIRALARKGEWVKGQYAIVFMNGCDTYAYVDSALNQAHAAVNPDDPKGTKYLDIVMNSMPSYFSSNAPNMMALIQALMNPDTPRNYEQIFADLDSSQVVLVSGEEDNTFVPGGGGGGGGEENWQGMKQQGTVKRNEEARWATPKLAAGRYFFELKGNNDADLYVRIGSEPTTKLYDCRPYRYGSHETCAVELPSASTIHVMVRGWAASSDFQLEGRKQ